MVWKYEDGYGSPTWEFIMHDADRAARGDRRAALRLLRDLKDCLANEKPIHDELVSYLLVCIRKIVEGLNYFMGPKDCLCCFPI